MRSFLTTYALLVLTVILAAGLVISIRLPADKTNLVHGFAIGVSVAALVIGLLIRYAFDKAVVGFQFQSRRVLLPEYGLEFTLGLDGLSLLFVLLTLFVFPVCFVAA